MFHMIKKYFLSVSIVLLMLIIPVSVSAFTLSGKVTNSNSAAIENADVNVVDNVTQTNVATASTDSSGSYTLNVSQGVYDIHVDPPAGSGYGGASVLEETISSNKVINFIITNANSVVLSGHIYDPLGNPVADQKVRLGKDGVNTEVSTDTNGAYMLQVEPGNYEIHLTPTNFTNSFSVNLPGRYNISAPLTLNESRVLNITFPAKKVTVHVEDSSANPVAGVRVDVPNTQANNGELPIGAEIMGTGASGYDVGPITDSSGDVVLWVLPTNESNTYSFVARPPAATGYGVTSLNEQSVTSDTNIAIALAETFTLEGHVYDTLGNGLPDQLIWISENGSTTDIVTDATGKYSAAVTAGEYEFHMRPANFTNETSLNVPQRYDITGVNTLNISENTVFDITFPVVRVDVHVKDPLNNAVAGVRINVPYTNANQEELLIGNEIFATGVDGYDVGPMTDASGNATLWLFPTNQSNSYTFAVVPPLGSLYGSQAVTDITLSEDTSRTITLEQPVTLSGHIYDALGNPLVNQQIRIEKNGTNTEAVSNSLGAYSLSVTSGEYMFYVRPEDFNNPLSVSTPQNYELTGPITLTTNKTFDITVPAKKVTFQVKDPGNNPISNVRIDAPFVQANSGSLNLGSGVTVSGTAGYGAGPLTNASGNANLWLLPTDQTNTYSFIATPPAGSIYSIFALNNVTVTSDQNEVISLQFVHSPPVTTISLLPYPNAPNQYSNPVTVTLSASAASGFSIGSTKYKVDSGAVQTYSGPFTVSGNGDHTVRYWSVDNAGVFEAEKTKEFVIQNRQLTSLSPAKVWVGAGSLLNIGIKFDLKAEVYKNSTLVSSGTVQSVPAGLGGFNTAHLSTIPFNTFSAVDFPAGSVLGLKVYARNACTGSLRNFGVASLWFNDSQANSQFGATVAAINSNYFVRSDSLLTTSLGTGPRQSVDVAAGAKCSPYKLFGTWTITP